jgi:hypothetical protein
VTVVYQANVIKMFKTFNIMDRATTAGSSNDVSKHNNTLWSCPRPTHAASTLLVSCTHAASTLLVSCGALVGADL